MTRLVFSVDPGNANVGWAVVEVGSRVVHALGAITTRGDKEIEAGTNYLRRAHAVSCSLRTTFAEFHAAAAGDIVIVAESMLMFGSAQSVLANALPHGSLVMLAAEFGVELSTVGAARWQRAINGTKPRAGKRIAVPPPADPKPKPRRSLGARLAEEAIRREMDGPKPVAKRGRGKTDHSAMYRRLVDYVERRGAYVAKEALAGIGAVTYSNHALDAVGIGIYRASGLPVQTITLKRHNGAIK